MVNCQLVRGGRSGTSFHEGHSKYRLNGAKRAILVDSSGLPAAVKVPGAKTHEVRAARELLDEVLHAVERVTTVMGDRGFRGVGAHLERDYGDEVVIKHRAGRAKGEFKPMKTLWRVEVAFAELGRWRRLDRSFEGTVESAAAWLPGRV